jgi:hypothetical protein
MPKKIFVRCEKCGKKLIERLPNGLWKFAFGQMQGQGQAKSPVEMLIHGSIKMRCLRRSCRAEHPDHWNMLHYFPNRNIFEHAPPNQPKAESDMQSANGAG